MQQATNKQCSARPTCTSRLALPELIHTHTMTHTAPLRVARRLLTLLLSLLLHFIRRPWKIICPVAKANHLPHIATELVVCPSTQAVYPKLLLCVQTAE
jgi:hypothetical protein